MNFQNLQIEMAGLPNSEEVEYSPIERKYLRVLLIQNLIFLLPFLIATNFFHFFLNETLYNWIGFAIISSLVLIRIIFQFVSFDIRGYAIRENDILFKKGLLKYKETIVTFNRVQHVELVEGPIMRTMNLASLKIFTAGGSQSDLSIKGLQKEEAQKLKDFISEKVKQHA